MCGFVAVICRKDSTTDLGSVEAMTEAIAHRGPDDHGYFIDNQVAFGFRRLSILDLSPLGHQPMTSSDGRYTMVFNGEIYNYRELRAELEALGHNFRSTGDSEVLLTAYIQWGPTCLSKLNGMWAFVVYSHADRSIFGSRDRFGIKPLYIFDSARGIVLASEIKSIRLSPWFQGNINEAVFAEFVQRGGLDLSESTFFQGIDSLPPAHAFQIDRHGNFRKWCWWNVPEDVDTRTNENHLVDEFGQLFSNSMELHMRSDVPIGVNLSGGLDSTSIICAASRIRQRTSGNQELLAFSYFDKAFDESAYIAETVKLTGARIVRLDSSPQELWGQMDEVVRFQDEPVHSMSAVVGNALMRLAKQNEVKVLLNGQGADETLGGYPDYFQNYWHGLLASGNFTAAWSEIASYSRGHNAKPTSLFLAAIKRELQELLGSSSFYRACRMKRRDQQALQAKWLHPNLRQTRFADQTTAPISLKMNLIRSIRQGPLPLFLRVEDRNSMHHSVEARVPFLDYRLVEMAMRCPDHELMRGPWNKYLLRRAMRGRIPASVVNRIDKMGFPTSFGDWIKTWLHDEIYETLGDAPDCVKERVDISGALRRLKEHRQGLANHSRGLFAIVQVSKWARAVGYA